jgi:hypothetical protein
MSAITIENGSVKIAIEAVEGDGMVVLTLAPGAYLILRKEALANYPREKLAELERLVREMAPEPEFPSYYHPSKVRALKELRARGIAASGGEEYFSEIPKNPPTLEHVREILSKVKGSLSDEVIANREER